MIKFFLYFVHSICIIILRNYTIYIYFLLFNRLYQVNAYFWLHIYEVQYFQGFLSAEHYITHSTIRYPSTILAHQCCYPSEFQLLTCYHKLYCLFSVIRLHVSYLHYLVRWTGASEWKIELYLIRNVIQLEQQFNGNNNSVRTIIQLTTQEIQKYSTN